MHFFAPGSFRAAAMRFVFLYVRGLVRLVRNVTERLPSLAALDAHPDRHGSRAFQSLAISDMSNLESSQRHSIETRILRYLWGCFWPVVLLPFAGLQQAWASPAITSVENAASNIAPGLPGASIAQGAIFVVKGSGLGAANLATATAAFQNTSLSNTSIAVTVNGVTTHAFMYYSSATQLAALLPSNTPTGAGQLTVTYNGQTSVQAPIEVVANNVGIFTIDSSGQGPGIVTYPDYSLVSAIKANGCGGPNTACGAANPGDTLTLWATGLGPISGSDAAGAGLGQNMPNIPLAVLLGGVQAPVTYQGRSGCCIGEDQIVFTVPANVPTGCAVPLVVQIGSQVSNSAVIPVANGSRDCTTANPALQNAEQLAMAGPPFAIGDIDLEHDVANGGYQDLGQFEFENVLSFQQPNTQPFLVSWSDAQPLGTCIDYSNLKGLATAPFGNTASADAGAGFTVTGPGGSATITANGNSGQFTTLSSTGSFLVPGAYTVTGTGGAGIGPFQGTITIHALPTLVNPQAGAVVTRSNGMTVTWTGGDPAGTVEIEISSATDSTSTNGALAVCTAPAAAGSFTIPPYVLDALPAGDFAGLRFSSPETYGPAFTASGLGLGFVQFQNQGAGFGTLGSSGSFTLK